MKATNLSTSIGHCSHNATTPTAVLRHEHEVILRALALLEKLGAELEGERPVDRKTLEWLVGFFKTFADRCHHGKEEQHLFPTLEQHGVPKQGGPLGVLLTEHEEGRALVRAIATEEGRQAAEAIHHYVALLRGHIEKENEVLFPMAEDILSAEKQGALLLAFEKVEQEMGGADLHERLETELVRLEQNTRGPDLHPSSCGLGTGE